MWKSAFNDVTKRFIIHSPCGNRCGNNCPAVDYCMKPEVFHISTGPNSMCPVEMWKTNSQTIDIK
jgi:hypothetical protein